MCAQYYFPMPDGSGLKLTVAKYLTPSRYDISREGGLQPDVSCSDFPRRGVPSAANDACISRALEALEVHASTHAHAPPLLFAGEPS
jgi:C-terminal processing protease CtpA/Prc